MAASWRHGRYRESVTWKDDLDATLTLLGEDV